MKALLNALVAIDQLLGAATWPSDLSTAEQTAAGTMLLASVCGLVAVRALSRGPAPEITHEIEIEYDEVA